MRPPRSLLAVAVLLAYGAACNNGEHPDAPSAPTLPQEIELAPGASARVDGLTVKFDGVSGDSRCPTGVMCVWEGDAVVVIEASEPPRAASDLELHTSARFPHEGLYGRYRIELVSLVPQPREGEPVSAGSYRATVRVTLQ